MLTEAKRAILEADILAARSITPPPVAVEVKNHPPVAVTPDPPDLGPLVEAVAGIAQPIVAALAAQHIEAVVDAIRAIPPAAPADLSAVVAAIEKTTAAVIKLAEAMSAPKKIVFAADDDSKPIGIELAK